jgi:hypothetical protein
MWLYDIWEERQHKITPLRKLELEIIDLKNMINEKNKQINNIYEILETLTNESKNKFNNIDESNSNDVKQVSL